MLFRSRFRSVSRFILCAGRGHIIFVLFVLLGLLPACSKDESGSAKAQDTRKQTAVPVTVGVAVEKTVPVQLSAIGNVQAYATVSVKARVDGELTIVHFKEGQEVKRGDLLFTIDPRSYVAQLKQAEANLARDKAQLQNARKQVERYTSVAKKGLVAEEQYDKVLADSAALEASVKADEAAVENAKLKVEYCTIRSPIDGVTGGVKVNQGNIIKANDNELPLVVINQIKPVYVSFAVPERNLLQIKKLMEAGKLEVSALLPGEDMSSVQGEVSFIENAVDMNTGTIQVRATFQNRDKMLWPGQFVNVVLTLTTQAGAVVIPSQALQAGQQGQYVFILKPDQTVEYRPVTVERTVGNEAVITKGISAGETVVTDGQLRLASGSLVKVVENSAN
ncbi:MAG: efflux RND transporter periplasmic adaptor subunit [Syntrophobacteraceae bacterium]